MEKMWAFIEKSERDSLSGMVQVRDGIWLWY